MVIGISKTEAQSGPRIVVIDYQDFGKMVDQVDKQDTSRATALRSTVATLEGKPGAEKILAMEKTMLTKEISPEAKYALIVSQCRNSKTALVNQPLDSSTPIPTPTIKEKTDVLVISTDGKIQACIINTENAVSLISLQGRLQNLDTLDSIRNFVAQSYSLQ